MPPVAQSNQKIPGQADEIIVLHRALPADADALNDSDANEICLLSPLLALLAALAGFVTPFGRRLPGRRSCPIRQPLGFDHQLMMLVARLGPFARTGAARLAPARVPSFFAPCYFRGSRGRGNRRLAETGGRLGARPSQVGLAAPSRRKAVATVRPGSRGRPSSCRSSNPAPAIVRVRFVVANRRAASPSATRRCASRRRRSAPFGIVPFAGWPGGRRVWLLPELMPPSAPDPSTRRPLALCLWCQRSPGPAASFDRQCRDTSSNPATVALMLRRRGVSFPPTQRHVVGHLRSSGRLSVLPVILMADPGDRSAPAGRGLEFAFGHPLAVCGCLRTHLTALS